MKTLTTIQRTIAGLVLIATLALMGCGSSKSNSEPNKSVSTTAVTDAPTTTTAKPGWIEQMRAQGTIPADAREIQVDGNTVLVSDSDRMIFVQDCATAQRLTAEGAQFGPVPYSQGGTGQAGYGTFCDK